MEGETVSDSPLNRKLDRNWIEASAKITRLEAALAAVTAERDALRDREAKAKAEIARLETTNLILQGIIVELNEQHAGK